MKRPLPFGLLVLGLAPLAVSAQTTPPVLDTSIKVRAVVHQIPGKDSLWNTPTAKDNLRFKAPGLPMKSPPMPFQSMSPINIFKGTYGSVTGNVSGNLKSLNPLSGHTSSIRVSNVSAQVMADYINGPVPLGSLAYGTTGFNMVSGQISGTVSLFNVPLNVGYNYQVLQGGLMQQSYTGTAISFNRDAFTQYLASRLQSKLNPASYLPAQFAAMDKMKENALGDMQKDVSGVENRYSATLTSGVNLNDWKTINSTDAGTLQRMIIPDSLSKAVSGNNVQLAQMQAKMNNHEPIDTVQYNKILAQNQELKGREEVYNVVLGYRQKWSSSGLVSMVQRLELEKATALTNIAKDPAIVGSLARQNLSLNSLEKLFVNLRSLNLGKSVTDMSPMTLQQSVMQNGVGAQFLGSSNNAFGLNGGKMPSQASGYEQLFSGNSFNNAMAMSGLNLGKGSMQGNGSMMTLNMFKSNAMSGVGGMFPFGSGGLQNFVMTFGKSLQIGEHGHLTFELSKSLSTGGAGKGGSGLSAGSLASGNDFFKTLGVSVDFSNAYPKLHLTQDLKFLSAASDFSNPGNAYLFSGMKEVSSDLQKTFLNGKLNVLLRNNYTSFLTNPLVNQRFVQYNNVLDLRWKMKKGNYLSLKYQPSWSNNIDSGMNTRVGMIQRVSADLNYNKRVGRRQLHTYTSLAYVNNTFADSIASASFTAIHSIQLNSMVGMSIKSCQAYINNTVAYTPQSSAYLYLNSTWTSEGGYMYPLGKRLQASSGLNFVTVSHWYEQLGMKQSLTGNLSSHMNLTAYIDIGKNLVVYQTFPVPTFRGNLMVSYHL